ncbi:MAG: hypothetical protein HOE30_13275 [Deltaproteobacteria bacterium]|nr:hypothetical protein [Deltaproteobacteria bacterium]
MENIITSVKKSEGINIHQDIVWLRGKSDLNNNLTDSVWLQVDDQLRVGSKISQVFLIGVKETRRVHILSAKCPVL